MLEGESLIQDALNKAGALATRELLKQFDADGSPIELGPVKMTSKGLVIKQYQTPYGVAEVARHVYQTSEGGSTFCPLDRDARIIVSSTPRFAKQISHKFSEMASTKTRRSAPAIDAVLAGGEAALLSSYCGEFCCSIYCLIIESGAPPHVSKQ